MPYLIWASLRPSPENAFDPGALHTSLVWPTLALRLIGFALVTPFMEELFVRSWLARYIESMSTPKMDFRDVPMARFTIRSFLAVVLWFTFSHARWEWPVAVAWIKTYKSNTGKTGRVFTTTMGASQDFQSEGLRRLLVNACYWALGMEDQIRPRSNVAIVGTYEPTPFRHGGHQKGLRPRDHQLSSR